jgi:hypothetical protein
MSGANLARAEVHDSRLSQRRAEGVKLSLPEIAELDSVGFGEADPVSRPGLIGIEPGAPDDHLIGLRRRILVQFRPTLRCDDAGVATLAALLIRLTTDWVGSASPEPRSGQ